MQNNQINFSDFTKILIYSGVEIKLEPKSGLSDAFLSEMAKTQITTKIQDAYTNAVNKVKNEPLELNYIIRILKLESRAYQELSPQNFEIVAKKIEGLVTARLIVEVENGMISRFFNRFNHWIHFEGFQTDAEFAIEFIEQAKKNQSTPVSNYFQKTKWDELSFNSFPANVKIQLAAYDEAAIEKIAKDLMPLAMFKACRLGDDTVTETINAFCLGHGPERQGQALSAMVKGLSQRVDFLEASIHIYHRMERKASLREKFLQELNKYHATLATRLIELYNNHSQATGSHKELLAKNLVELKEILDDNSNTANRFDDDLDPNKELRELLAETMVQHYMESNEIKKMGTFLAYLQREITGIDFFSALENIHGGNGTGHILSAENQKKFQENINVKMLI